MRYDIQHTYDGIVKQRLSVQKIRIAFGLHPSLPKQKTPKTLLILFSTVSTYLFMVHATHRQQRGDSKHSIAIAVDSQKSTG